MVALDTLTSAKIVLSQEMARQNLTNTQLAERLRVNERVVRRLRDLDHESKIGKVEEALRLLGYRLLTSAQKISKAENDNRVAA